MVIIQMRASLRFFLLALSTLSVLQLFAAAGDVGFNDLPAPRHGGLEGAPLERHTSPRAPPRKESFAAVSVRKSRGGLRSRFKASTKNWVPPYVPKIGIANVTTATAFPPPPPTLNPITDYQPMDTAVGNYIAAQFVAPPTLTPPPSQAAISLAYGCPVLLTWPGTVEVHAPTGCGGIRENMWTDPSGTNQMNWTETCSPEQSAMPMVTYHIPHPTDPTKKGDLFGYSKTQFSLYGTKIDLLDCGLNKVWTIEEKVYHHTGTKDGNLCALKTKDAKEAQAAAEKAAGEGKKEEESMAKLSRERAMFDACDGQVYLQYFIYDGRMQLQALSPYIPNFASSFAMTTPGGIKIVDFSRMGGWSPKAVCPDYKKTWGLKYAGGVPGPFGDTTQQWVFAMMATMMSLRDEERRMDGMVSASGCEIYDSVVILIVMIVISVLFCLAACIIITFCMDEVRKFCFAFEDALFPKRMHKPSKFDT